MIWQNQAVFPLLIINASGGFTGLFVYSPSPGLGNLLASTAAQAGTDPYGNAYLSGDAVYDAANFVAIQLAPSTLAWHTAPGPGGPWTRVLTIARVAGQLQLSGILTITLGLVVTAGGLTVSAGGLDVSGASDFRNGLVVGAAAPTTTADLEVHSLVALASRAAPGTPPAGFGFLYVSSVDGSLHYKGHSGTDTQIAPG